MQAAHQVIVWLRLRHERTYLRFGHATWIGNLCKVRAITFEIPDVLVGRHPHDHEFTSLIRLADRLDLHSRCRRRECAIVFQDVRVVRELCRRTDVISKHIFRHWNAGHARKVIDERASELCIARPFRVHLCEIGVLLLLRITRFIDGCLRRNGGSSRDGSDREREDSSRDEEVRLVAHAA